MREWILHISKTGELYFGKRTTWYARGCQDCIHITVEEDALNNLKEKLLSQLGLWNKTSPMFGGFFVRKEGGLLRALPPVMTGLGLCEGNSSVKRKAFDSPLYTFGTMCANFYLLLVENGKIVRKYWETLWFFSSNKSRALGIECSMNGKEQLLNCKATVAIWSLINSTPFVQGNTIKYGVCTIFWKGDCLSKKILSLFLAWFVLCRGVMLTG